MYNVDGPEILQSHDDLGGVESSHLIAEVMENSMEETQISRYVIQNKDWAAVKEDSKLFNKGVKQ